ncbi:MAG: hypothetical protein Q4A21_02630 [bacterium]|nr:hypothetical protein [bacterium]
MKNSKILGQLMAALLVGLAIAGILFLFWLNKPKENKAVASQQAVASVASSSKKEETAADLGDYFKEDDKFTEISNKNLETIITADKAGDGFQLFDIKNIPNKEMKISPSRPGEDAIRANSPQAAVSQILWSGRHNEVALENLLRQYGIPVPAKLAEEKGGKRFLTQDAQNAYYQVEKIFTTATLESGAFDLMKNTTSTGMGKGGVLVQDENPRDWSNYQMLQVVYNGKAYYHNYYCENAQLHTPYKTVPKKEIPAPPTPPKEKTPPPTTQTPPPSTTTVPKKAEEAPPMPQGGGKVDGSNNPPTSWVEPPAEYVAPEAPKPSEQTTQPSAPQGNQGSGGGVTPPSNWQGNGGFSDSNGRTNVGSDGSVQTPSGDTRPGLTGQNVVVPPVQNGGTTNQGVNDGSKDANEIPMDD